LSKSIFQLEIKKTGKNWLINFIEKTKQHQEFIQYDLHVEHVFQNYHTTDRGQRFFMVRKHYQD